MGSQSPFKVVSSEAGLTGRRTTTHADLETCTVQCASLEIGMHGLGGETGTKISPVGLWSSERAVADRFRRCCFPSSMGHRSGRNGYSMAGETLSEKGQGVGTG